MDLAFTPDEDSFRVRLRRWLEEDPPEAREFDSLDDEVRELRRWQRRLYDGGWVALHWPKEYGGQGATIVENFLFAAESACARSPELIGRIGLNLVGPTLIAQNVATVEIDVIREDGKIAVKAVGTFGIFRNKNKAEP